MKNIKIYLDKKININQGSTFQGFLMEKLDTFYAQKLHEESLRPYSQYLKNISDKGIWCINLYNVEVENKMLPILQNTKVINIEQKNIIYEIENVEIKEDSVNNSFVRYTTLDNSRYITIQFVTPTAFKQNEQYYYFPDIKLIFQSILNKYNFFNSDSILDDETFLIPIVENSYICDYKIMTKNYYIEQTKIKGFIGKITIKINGPMPLVNLAHFVLHYGTYTGIGIKTAMGMGGIKITNNDKI